MSCQTSRLDSTISDAMTKCLGKRFLTSVISRRFVSMERSLMSSMLFKPIIFTPFRSMAPKREEVFRMGSPIVFQTAPPQPASNARMTWPPVLVGGPEASQKGFGERKPQKFTDRSDILPPHFIIG